VEAQPGATHFFPRKGSGNGLCGHAVGGDSDPHMTRCESDCGGASSAESGNRGGDCDPCVPKGGALGSPTRLELEESEGATMALTDVETEAGLLAEPEEARTWGDEHLDQVSDPPVLQVALEGNQE
jgi:hypothetical protein